MKKIIITGCAGFIGWKVTEKLLEQGAEVLGIDNLNDYYDPKLKWWRLSSLANSSNFTFSKSDINNLADMQKQFSGFRPEAVIHLAARAGVRPSLVNPWIYYETNVHGTLNILECCRKYGVKKYVFASSSSVYGGNKIPFSEDDDTSRPLSPYGATKKAGEALAYTYHYQHGFDAVVLRYFSVYGPAGRPDMSPFLFMSKILAGERITVFGDGTQKRDFTYIDDVADGTVKALGISGFHVINLGNNKPIDLNQLIRIIEEYSGKKATIEYQPRNSADVLATWADIRKSKETLNWQPKVEFEDGMKRLLDWYVNTYKKVKN